MTSFGPEKPAACRASSYCFRRSCSSADVHLVANEDREAELAGEGERLPALDRDADRRVRLLVRLGHELHVAEPVVLALVREALLGPGLENDLQRLEKERPALRVVDVVPLVGFQERAAADAEDQTALAEVVDDRRLFGHAQGVGERQDLHRQADPDAPGARGDGARADERRGEHRALRPEMRFAEPEGVERRIVGHLHQAEPLLKDLRLGRAFARAEHREDAEVHEAPTINYAPVVPNRGDRTCPEWR